MTRFGPRRPLLAGLCFVAAGLALLSTAGAGTAYAPTLVGSFLLIGVGAGCVVVALVAAVLWVRAPGRAEEVGAPEAGGLAAETVSS